MRISLLRFFKKIHKFALCEFMPYTNFISAIFLAIFAQQICLMQILGYSISLMRFFLANFANANFG